MIITNNYTTQAECIATVRDCSTGEYKFSYRTIGITALTLKKKMPMSVYTRVFTNKENEFVSEIEETINALKFLK